VKLTPRAAAVLQMLVERAPEVVTKTARMYSPFVSGVNRRTLLSSSMS
jgi:hypothetical protein